MNTLSDAFDIADLLDPTHPAWELPSIRREVGRLVLDSMRGHKNGAPIFVGTADAALMLGLAHGTMYQFASNSGPTAYPHDPWTKPPSGAAKPMQYKDLCAMPKLWAVSHRH